VVDADDRRQVDAALAVARRDPRASVLTANGLKLQLSYGNPWEHAALAAANPALQLEAPPAESFRLAARLSLHAEIPRSAAIAGNQRVVGPVYAQRRLHADHGIVAASLSELDRLYAARYGAPLDTDTTVEEFFRGPYLEVRRILDELAARQAAGAVAAAV
jgi:hypothetical protein